MKTCSFRVFNVWTNALAAILILVCIFAILTFMVHVEPGAASGIMKIYLFIALLGTIAGAKYLSKHEATLTFLPESLEIETIDDWLYKSKKTYISTVGLRGFEIIESKVYQCLIIYKNGENPIILYLFDSVKDKLKITEFLSSEIPLINKKKRLSEQSFATAFLKGLKFNALLILFISITYMVALWIYYSRTGSFSSVGPASLFWIALPVSVLFGYNYLHHINNLRIQGRMSTWYFILLISITGVLTIPNISYPIFKEPGSLKSISEIWSVSKEKYIQPAKARIDTFTVGYYENVSSSGKSLKLTVTHYLTSPIPEYENQIGGYRIWTGSSFQQQIRKNISPERKRIESREFLKEKYSNYKELIKQKPMFYEVVHSEVNQNFYKRNFYRSAKASATAANPVIILKPHFESFDDFRTKARKQVAIALAVIAGLLMINSWIIAYHR